MPDRPEPEFCLTDKGKVPAGKERITDKVFSNHKEHVYGKMYLCAKFRNAGPGQVPYNA